MYGSLKYYKQQRILPYWKGDKVFVFVNSKMHTMCCINFRCLFQMIFLIFDIFVYSDIQKPEGLNLLQLSAPNAIYGCNFFLPLHIFESRPKYQKMRKIFFKKHLKLLQYSVQRGSLHEEAEQTLPWALFENPSQELPHVHHSYFYECLTLDLSASCEC